jgi:hypothetical protein
MPRVPLAAAELGDDAEASYSGESDNDNEVVGDAASNDGGYTSNTDGGDSYDSSTAGSSSWGRIEPGAVAMAAAGPVLATVDTLGK